MERYDFIVEAVPERNRLDVYLAEALPDLTRSYLKRLIEEGCAKVNGKPAKASLALKIGDCVAVEVPDPVEIDLTPQNIPVEIVYEDEDLAVVNKPQGLTVHPSETERSKTLVNALLYRLDSLSGVNGKIRPGIVHRIDKNTSGLLVVAKNDAAHRSLARQLEDKTCYRVYRAVLEGVVAANEGTVDAPLARSRADRKKMTVAEGGRRAVTHYRVLRRYPKNTYVEFRLETGRTHQIRVHAKYMGHPVVGDDVYGYRNQRFSLNGQLLHAYELSFIHPRTGQRVSFTAPLPDYFEKVLNVLENALQSPPDML